jgi:hypothetical protein
MVLQQTVHGGGSALWFCRGGRRQSIVVVHPSMEQPGLLRNPVAWLQEGPATESAAKRVRKYAFRYVFALFNLTSATAVHVFCHSFLLTE